MYFKTLRKSIQLYRKESVCSIESVQTNMKFGRYESPYWRYLAAMRIQVAWRYRKRRLSRVQTSQSN